MSDYPHATTAEQFPLFDNPQVPKRSESKAESKATKRDSYRASRERSSQQREDVLAVIVAAGTEGITRKEISKQANILLSSVCGRVNELTEEEPPRVFQRGRRGGGAILFAVGHQ